MTRVSSIFFTIEADWWLKSTPIEKSTSESDNKNLSRVQSDDDNHWIANSYHIPYLYQMVCLRNKKNDTFTYTSWIQIRFARSRSEQFLIYQGNVHVQRQVHKYWYHFSVLFEMIGWLYCMPFSCLVGIRYPYQNIHRHSLLSICMILPTKRKRNDY